MDDKKRLSRIIGNLVMSRVKQDDAPCSSSTHFNTALYELLEMHGCYCPQSDESREVIEEAIAEVEILKLAIAKID